MNNRTEAEAALAAMNRAAETARVRAARFGSRLAIWQNGAVVLIEPSPVGVEQSTDEPAPRSQSKAEGGEAAQPEPGGHSR